MVTAESRDVGMDKALERARTLYTAVEVALKNHRLDSHEMSGLREIRTNIAMLENKIREIKVTNDTASKAGMLAELHPIRQQLIEECHRNQDAVVESQGLIQEILDWCELRASTSATPATYRASIDDVQRSTEALITNSGLGTATDVSSSWVQSQAQAPHSKSSAFGSSAASLSLSNWDPKQTRLRPLKTGVSNSSAAHSNGTSKASLPSAHAQTLPSKPQQQQHPGTPDQLRSDQTLVPPAVVAAGAATPKIHQATDAARAHAAKLTAQRQSMEQQALEQQQQQSWEGQLNEAQQLARRLTQTQRPVRSFLHLDGRTDASLTSSGASSQLAAYYPLGDMGVSRYSNQKDDDVSDLEPAAANGWEAVQHLRQPAAHRSSMRTSVDRASMDIQRALRSGNVTEAAILSSNASRVHILHDAVPKKRRADGQMFDVPVIPPCLAVNKKRRWWMKLLHAVATTAGLTVAVGAAGIAATGGFEGIRDLDTVKSRFRTVTRNIKIHKPQTPSLAAEPNKVPASKTDTSAASSSSGGSAVGGQQQLQQQKPVGMPRLPYVPIGPAPDASAGCG